MSRAALMLALLAGPALAEGPRFDPRPDAFPVAHVYPGGWEHFVGGGVAVLDCNGDGRPDIVAAGGTEPARLFVNATPAPGAPIRFDMGTLPDLRGVTGLWPLDIDGDGALDLAVLRVGANLLMRGDGACGFTDVSGEWGFAGGAAWSTALSATWEDGATRPTLAIGNYVDRADPQGPFGACDDNELHRPRGDRYGPPRPIAPGYCALSMLISDWQRSGTPELRISNDRHYYVRGGYEEMWRLDPLSPRTEADGWARVSLWGMGIASADLTGDGFPEVMLTSMGDQLLQFNDAGTMRNAPFATGAAAQRPYTGDDGRPSTGWHAEFGDIDNDARLDLFIAKGNVDQMPSNAMRDPNNLLMGRPDGTFTEAGLAAGIADDARSRGGALADFDGDGRLDLVASARRAPLALWQNATPGAGNWLAVDLSMPAPNTRAVGAWIALRTPDGRTHWREVTVGGGHGGGQAGPIHFGLGDATRAEIRVTWPGGRTGPWHEATAGQVVTLSPDP
ncbi:CRTAC1 family protein [Palleronia sediminis]|uniref:CRTAC1 family protein n=1 Tax=Palleronia sediminis TaxID=2547833 RepID=A0A4R6AEH0_9RHOB|nr:CRTAC1 family protein [Palleronia sediminis]TDL81354.1 CRTAC1 family protein [Palleronia sediminis]